LFDFLSFIIFFSFLGFLVFIVLLGVKLFSNIANAGQSSFSGYSEETDNQLREDSIEDSNGDGLMGIDEGNDYNDIFFPEEANGEEDF